MCNDTISFRVEKIRFGIGKLGTCDTSESENVCGLLPTSGAKRCALQENDLHELNMQNMPPSPLLEITHTEF